MKWEPHITVATVVEDNGLFLLVKEHSDSGAVLNQPAGHLEPNESLEQAALRETLEETRWHVRLTGVLGITVCDTAQGVTYLRVTFSARKLTEAADAELDPNIIEPLWLSYDDIVKQKDILRSPMVLNDIHRYRTHPPATMEILDYIPLK